MVYRQQGKRIWYCKMPTRTGWKSISTGSRDKAQAKAVERMLADLGPQGKRRWDLLEAVAEKRLPLARLWDHYVADTLDAALAELAEVDLDHHVAPWQRWLAGQVKPDTCAEYRRQLRTLIPEGRAFPRSKFTGAAASAWVNGLPHGNQTKRNYFRTAQSFVAYLIEVGVLEDSPLRKLTPPAPVKPRLHWLPTPEVQRVVDAANEPYRSLFAVLYGTGIEVSVGCALRRRDVDLARREIFAAGTKTHCRERTVRVAEWAWSYVEAVCAGKLPDAPLFPGMSRYMATHAHGAVCKALGLRGYQLRDSRHSWAVRAAKAGTPAEIIARQLGHADPVMVLRVYGRFMPSQHDRDRWERVADAQDQQRAKEGQG
jgi:integrase